VPGLEQVSAEVFQWPEKYALIAGKELVRHHHT
jgi:hypothetical protein